MAQLTQGLIDEFRRAIEAGEEPPYTLNEFKQLLHAWEQLQAIRSQILPSLAFGCAN